MGNVRLHGSDNRTWSSDEWRADLVSLNPWVDESPLFSWISDTATYWYHRTVGYRRKVSKDPDYEARVLILAKKPGCEEHHAGTVVYERSTILRLTWVITTILACVLPIASTILLYTIASMAKRLWTMAIFTVLFSLALIATTRAGMTDIFAATAT